MKKPTSESIQSFIHGPFMQGVRSGETAPMRPMENPYFVAGLLYDWWEDGTERYLNRYHQPNLCIIKYWNDSHGRDSLTRELRIPVSDGAIEAILNKRWIASRQMPGYTDEKLLILSQHGRSEILGFLKPELQKKTRYREIA